VLTPISNPIHWLRAKTACLACLLVAVPSLHASSHQRTHPAHKRVVHCSNQPPPSPRVRPLPTAPTPCRKRRPPPAYPRAVHHLTLLPGFSAAHLSTSPPRLALRPLVRSARPAANRYVHALLFSTPSRLPIHFPPSVIRQRYRPPTGCSRQPLARQPPTSPPHPSYPLPPSPTQSKQAFPSCSIPSNALHFLASTGCVRRSIPRPAAA
jgi:hypothetical protein